MIVHGAAGGGAAADSGVALRRDGVGSGAADAAGRARPDRVQHDAGAIGVAKQVLAEVRRDELRALARRHAAAGDGRRDRAASCAAALGTSAIAARRQGSTKEQHRGSDVTRVEKPWGYELHWAKTDRYVGKLIHVNAGHALSLQYHNLKDETIYLHSGRLLFEIQEGGELVEARDAARASACTSRRRPFTG